ncbi:MAG: 16S rRNA (guanine(527)-N(7))-methyltransferase RsmG [Armatimonadota bacterium]|nr:16S rRNA (guanine(527)-N(7))-methyltransferase RsmG [Armatimonadota bacterium]
MEETLTEIVRRGANGVWELGLTDVQLAKFARYAEMLVEWNATRMNLTRLTSPRDIAVKHFLDSLALLTVVSVKAEARVLDVGTGAGLPGLALKIARPDLRLTLLDSTAKKLSFCQAVADELGLEGVKIVHARAEQAAKLGALAGPFDLVIARAVAPLNRLLPWLAPFVAPGGMTVALKGAGVAEELELARPMARALGLTLRPLVAVPLPEAEEPTVRQIVIASRKETL